MIDLVYLMFRDKFRNLSAFVISVSGVFIRRSIDESCPSDYGRSRRSIE